MTIVSAACTAFAVKEQTAFGTAASGTDDWKGIYQLGGTPNSTNETFMPSISGAAHRGKQFAVAGKVRGEHTLSVPAITGNNIGWLLKWLFGGVSSTVDNGGGSYTHTFNITSCEPLMTFTMYSDLINTIVKCVNSVVGGMTITLAGGEMIDMSFPVMYGHEVQTTEITPDYDTQIKPFTWSGATITLCSIELDQAESFTLNISNGAEAVYTMNGERGPGRFDPRAWEVSGELLIPMEDAVELKRSWGSESATSPGDSVFEGTFEAEFTSPDEIGTSGDYYNMKITMPRAAFSGYARQAGAPEDTVKELITFVPLVDTGVDIEIEITNGDASYPDAS